MVCLLASIKSFNCQLISNYWYFDFSVIAHLLGDTKSHLVHIYVHLSLFSIHLLRYELAW